MIDAYELDYLDSKDDCHKRLFEGGSDYIRWIPETKAECDDLKCVDCRRSLVNCCCSDREHGNCDYQNSLPDTIIKQSALSHFEAVMA